MPHESRSRSRKEMARPFGLLLSHMQTAQIRKYNEVSLGLVSSSVLFTSLLFRILSSESALTALIRHVRHAFLFGALKNTVY